MEIVNFEDLMRAKLAECDEWLDGYDGAVEKCNDCEKAYEEARVALEKAKTDVADYNDDNIKRVSDYKAQLEDKLGIVKPVEVKQEAVVADVAVAPVDEPVIGIHG